MKLPLIITIALAAATIAVNLDFGEAFGVPSSIAIVFPANGDGSIAIVCGILAEELPRIIQCSTVSHAGAGKAFNMPHNVTFFSVSSGRDIICGVKTGNGDSFCWKHVPIVKGSTPTNQTFRNVDHKQVAALTLAIGEEEIATTSERAMIIQRRRDNSSFPARTPGYFRSLTSGVGFFCAINDEDKVVCWGPKAENIYPAFEDEEMYTIFSGESHACGITKEGRVICGGNDDHGQSSPPDFSTPSGFTSLALGSAHTCAVEGVRSYKVVCWGDGVGEYSPSNDLELIIAVASKNLTCGVRADSLAVVCWWTSHGAPAKVIQLPLSRPVVFGLCSIPSFCPCGIIYSAHFCADSNAICKPCV